jgi:hypothetical protein
MEKYIIIDAFNNYAVSNCGNIKNVKNGKILEPHMNNEGYLTYTFCQDGLKKTFRIHRLVALYFLDNPNILPYVKHKDGNPLNNKVENLEWTKEKDQIKSKPILATNLTTGEKFVFMSTSEASALLNINKRAITRVLNSSRSKVHNYTFSFLQ